MSCDELVFASSSSQLPLHVSTALNRSCIGSVGMGRADKSSLRHDHTIKRLKRSLLRTLYLGKICL